MFNISKVFSPLYGFTFTHDELYGFIEEQEVPPEITPDDLIRFLKELKIIHENVVFYIRAPVSTLSTNYGYIINLEYIILSSVLEIGIQVSVLDSLGQTRFTYIRNDSAFNNTLCTFAREGHHYALYSSDPYQIELVDLVTGTPVPIKTTGSADDFYSRDLYIPCDPAGITRWAGYQGYFGFVAGHYLGDDSTDKIEYLDLSELLEGKLLREDRFGYVEMPQGIPLDKCIDLANFDPFDSEQDRIYIASRKAYSTSKNIGRRERLKRFHIASWVCHNRTCPGRGEVVVNPAVLPPLEPWRCPKCLELVVNVGRNFIMYDPEDL